MRKQKVQMVVLVAALTLLIGGYFLLQQYNKKQAEKEEENKIQVAEIDADAIEAFSYQLDGETLSFTKTDDNWSYDQNTELHMECNYSHVVEKKSKRHRGHQIWKV